ncbi:unnamed protein product [Cuscuta europaea]|uniref:Uncharacterized protein n=1 Tax=Cuscuta europaea TaxID=41803 RepID=A0A9P1EME2_CUSEU|nr:unnamed protein product [Cuscuta europaea]
MMMIQVGSNRGASGIDGFRLYGVTSMMCTHLGLVLIFTADYNDCFGHATKVDVVVYRMLVNNLIHDYPVTNSKLGVISSKTLETVGATILYDDQLPYQFKSADGLMQVRCGKGVHYGVYMFEAHLAFILWNYCDDAPGEETSNFQRCSYWLLEEEQSNIVLVHDREEKGSRRNYSRAREPPLDIPAFPDGKRDVNSSDVGITLGNLISQQYDYKTKSHATNTASLKSAQASDYEEAKTAVHNQLSTSGMHSFTEFLAIMNPKGEDELSAPYYPCYISNAHQGHFPAFPEKSTATYGYVPFQNSLSTPQSLAISKMNGQVSAMIGFTKALEEWGAPKGESVKLSKWFVDPKAEQNPGNDLDVSKGEDWELKVVSGIGGRIISLEHLPTGTQWLYSRRVDTAMQHIVDLGTDLLDA